MKELPIAYLRERLEYDPPSGIFAWKAGKRAGKRAGTVNSKGYVIFWVPFEGKKVQFRAHRVAFALIFGRWPHLVDHVNGIRDDNRLENLREVDFYQQRHNTRPPENKISGHTGVYRLPNGKWLARIRFHGKQMYLGHYALREDAALAYRAARRRLHPFYARGL